MEKPDRIRSKQYLKSIREKPCVVCGGISEAHHVTYAQPKAMARKVGDQYTIPLCHSCHMDLHDSPMPERTWWALNGIDPIKWAEVNYSNWEKENGE